VVILIHALNTFEPSRRVGSQVETFLIDLLPVFFIMLIWMIAGRWYLPGFFLYAMMGILLLYYYDAFPEWLIRKKMLLFGGMSLPLFVSSLLLLILWFIHRRKHRINHTVQ